VLVGQHEANALHSATRESDATPGGFHIEPRLTYLEVIRTSQRIVEAGAERRQGQLVAAS
jgi:hypothetical protein